MKTILCIKKQVEEEFKDAENYICCATHYKADYPELADTYQNYPQKNMVMQVNSTRAWSALSKITKRQNRHLNVCSKCGTSLKRIISKKPRTLK